MAVFNKKDYKSDTAEIHPMTGVHFPATCRIPTMSRVSLHQIALFLGQGHLGYSHYDYDL